METRSKRRQQELESAVSAAPVQTRSQKAAKKQGEVQKTSPAVPVEKKRKQPEPTEPGSHIQRKRSRATVPPAADKETKELGSPHPKVSPRQQKDQEPPKPSETAEQADMDRQRRDARRELEEAARMEQVLGLLHGK